MMTLSFYYTMLPLLLTALVATKAAAFMPVVPSRLAGVRPLMSTTTDEATTDINPRMQGLALLLDDGTRKAHSLAENTNFVTGFFTGLSTKEAYRNLLTSLYFVYTAMEESFDTTTDERVKILDDDKLRRLPSLVQDLEFFYGPDWKQVVQPSPAAKAYVARIQKVAETEPFLLIGHQYSRYLGDLFGGQMMGGMAQRSLDLQDNKGVDFYQFDDIPSTKDFITDWYERLNALDLTDGQREDIVVEANLVFALNIAILDELEGSAISAMFKLAVSSLKLKLGLE